jgi:hypothetical protein
MRASALSQMTEICAPRHLVTDDVVLQPTHRRGDVPFRRPRDIDRRMNRQVQVAGLLRQLFLNASGLFDPHAIEGSYSRTAQPGWV